MRKKAYRRRIIAAAVVGGNLAILGVVSAVILISSGNPPERSVAAATADTNAAVANPLDQVSSANIAQTVARLNRMPETTAVTNQADSESTELSLSPTTSNVVDKPQVVTSSGYASNKDIKTYTVVGGETISSIAAKFGITSDSIRWSNNITGDAVAAGTNLIIPPVTGIAYRVQSGDTAITLAAKYRADQNKIVAYNDAELSGLQIGELIIIPDGSKAALVAATTSVGSRTATFGGYNGYDFGYCTYWVAKLRASSGNPVPTNLGNASTWATRAAAMGLATGTSPRVGAAVVTSTRGAGHVAYVTGVNDDGTITISEMNHEGWNRVNSRTLADTGFRYVY